MYRKRINIPSHSTTEDAVYVSVPSFDATDTTKFQSDCGDLRFTKTNGELLKYYVVDCDATADIHVLFDTLLAGASDYFMYYGNASASDGYETTDFPIAATGLGSQSLASEQVTPGAVAAWKFNEGQGQAVQDETQNNNDGTLGANSGVSSDDPTWATEEHCVNGKCLKFDGSNDYLNINNTLNNIQTVGLWIRPQSISSLALIDVNGTARITVSSGTISATGFTSPTIYVNGVVSSTVQANTWQYVTVTTGTALTGSAFKVGAYSSTFMNGFIDDVSVYPYARSASQVQYDYVSAEAKLGDGNQSYLSNGLVGYWKMDETSGTTAADGSGNGNNGTLTNAQETGTADASGGSTTVLVDSDGTLSTTDDAYNGMILRVTNTCGSITANTDRLISDYTGATKTFTVSSAFASTLDSCQYQILHQVGGKFGNGMAFDGQDDYINPPTNFNFNSYQGFTISGWFNTNSPTPRQVIYNNSNGVILEVINSKIKATIRVSGGYNLSTGTTTLAASTWYFATLVYQQNQPAVLYLNGVREVASSGNVLYEHSGSSEDYIGRCSAITCLSEVPFFGKLDEVRIHNRALSPAEVADLYNFSPGPVGYWKFDEGSGTSAADSSGNGITGTWSGSGTQHWTSGKIGKAAELNQGGITNDQITYSTHAALDITNAITISAWLYPTGYDGNEGIFNKDTQTAYGLVLSSSAGRPRFKALIGGVITNCDAPAGTGVLPLNTWTHVTGLYDGNSIKIYINSKLMNSCAITGLIGTNSTQPTTSFGSASGDFQGKIDDIRVYNYARSPEQILQDMNAGSADNPTASSGQILPNASVYYALDEQQGSTANSSVPNSINGTISNATWKTKTNCKTNGCLSFDGSGDVVTIATASDSIVDFNASEQFSGSAWVYVTTMPGSGEQDAIIAKWDQTSSQRGYRLYVENDDADTTGNFEIEIYDESADQTIRASAANDSVALNTWYHVAFTFNGGVAGSAADLKLLVNGRQVASNAANASFLGLEDVTADFTIGEYDTTDVVATNTGFTGYIDEVNVYSGLLSTDQIQQDVNAGASLNMSVTAPSEATQLSDGEGAPPVAYWTFDEKQDNTCNGGTNDVCDRSGNGNDGAATNGPTWTRGKVGAAMQFDGVDDYVSFSSAPVTGTGSFSIFGWIQSPATGARKEIIYWGTGSTNAVGYLFINSSNYIQFDLENVGGPQSSTTVTNGQWHYVGVVNTAGSVQIYLNGQKSGSAVVMSPNIGNAGGRIGRHPNSNYFTGSIDDVKIYNYARTPAQVAYDYNRGAPIAHWQLDECQGSTIYDASGNNNHGTLNIGASGTQTAIGTCNTSGTAWGNGATGKYNSSLNFDGTDDYVSMGDPASGIFDFGSNDFTVSIWVKKGSPSADGGILTKEAYDGTGNSLDLYYFHSNSRYIYWNGSAAYSFGTATTSWQQLIVTRSGTTITMYSAGKLMATGTDARALTNAYPLVIGAFADYSQPFSGQIDDVKIWNYALSADQIKKLYNENSGARFAPSQGSAP
jgi:hypothetical protein